MSRRYAILAAIVAAFTLLGFAPQRAPASAAGPPGVVSATGLAQVAGQSAYVTVWVAVAPGEDAGAKADAVLARYGAVRADFSLEGSWKQFSDRNPDNDFVVQRYNGAQEPGGFNGRNVLAATEAVWSGVQGSAFDFVLSNNEGLACPSLLDECPGAQFFDGHNDVAWYPLADDNVLGVTWLSLRGPVQEADVTLNTHFKWALGRDDPARDLFEVETVLLHENGHVVGLDHSSDPDAVMYPVYQGVRTTLGADDIAGVLKLYGPKGGGGGNPGGGPPPGHGNPH